MSDTIIVLGYHRAIEYCQSLKYFVIESKYNTLQQVPKYAVKWCVHFQIFSESTVFCNHDIVYSIPHVQPLLV